LSAQLDFSTTEDGYIYYNGSSYNNNATVCYIGYTAGNGYHNGYYRIANVTIPKGAIIDSAYIRPIIYCVNGENPNLKIYAEAADNPSAVSSFSDYGTRSMTTAAIDWDMTYSTTETILKESPDIKTIIQEVIDRANWASGNAMQIFIKNDSSSYVTRTAAVENTTYAELILRINYHFNVSKSFTVTNTTCDSKNISLSSDCNLSITVINTTCDAKNVGIKRILHPPLIDTTCDAKTISINLDCNLVIPLINVTCDSKNIGIKRIVYPPLIDATCDAKNVALNSKSSLLTTVINTACDAKNVSLNSDCNLSVAVININLELPNEGIKRIVHPPLINTICDSKNVSLSSDCNLSVTVINVVAGAKISQMIRMPMVEIISISKPPIVEIKYWPPTSITKIYDSFDVLNDDDDGYIFTNPSTFYNAASWGYIGGTTAVRIHSIFNRYDNITIPKDAIIDSAYIRLWCKSTDNGTSYLRIYGCNEDDSNAVSSYSDFNAKPLTTEYTDINITCPLSNWVDSPSIKNIIQEIIDRAGWLSGNAIQILVKYLSDGKVVLVDQNLNSTLYVSYHISETENPIIIPDTTGDYYFHENRYETFEYELLSLDSSGIYKSVGFISNYVDTGSINIDFSRSVIGTCKFNIRNNTDINYISDLIRPWYIINDTYRYPLGTYMLNVPDKKANGLLVTRDIQGFDLLYALEQDKTIVSYNLTAGDNVVEAIEILLNSVGDWVKYNITASTEVLPENISYELGKSKLFIINSLLNMINYYPLWCNGKGEFMGIPWESTLNTTKEFIDNELSIYEPDISINMDYATIYNRVIIICNQLAANTAPLYKSWAFEDEGLSTHPFSYTSINRYVTKIFQSEAVSQSYVDLRARRELLKMLELEESINYNHEFVSNRLDDGLPWQGDAYRFKNTLLEIDSIYKIESQSFNLKVGESVQSKIKRIRSSYL
jgi:hypothetical protein